MKYRIEQERDGIITLIDSQGVLVEELVYLSGDELEEASEDSGLMPLFEKYSCDLVEFNDEFEMDALLVRR